MAKTYSQDEINKMTTAERSAAWAGADAASRDALHAANQRDLSATNTFDSASGTWTPKATTTAPTGYSGSATGVQTNTSTQDAIKAQMNANSQEWYTADDYLKEQLHAENERLAGLLGGSVGFDSVSGTWSGAADVPALDKVASGTSGGFTYGSAPTYTDSYSARIDAMLNEILNRDAFSYNAAEDDLYQQYASQYQREGQRAMQDTLGQLAARTGGLASSWAGSQAQQANNYYASQLADKVPELYQLAYQMYLDDIDLKAHDLGLLNDASDTQYSRYRDTMSDWRDDRNFAYNMYRDDVADSQWQDSFDYGAYRDSVADSQWNQNFAYNKYLDDRDYEYTVGRDEVEDARYDQEWQYMLDRDKIEDSRYDTEWNYKVNQDALDRQEYYGGGDDDDYTYDDEPEDEPSATKQTVSLPASNSGVPVGVSGRDEAKVSAKAKEIAKGLDTMRGQIGSKDAIANSLAIEIDRAGDALSEADARWLFAYFGYDPDEWLD